MRINGGEREGNNLFYSFDEFSILEGKSAVFDNATDIENIFIRITGDEISNINGILSTQGNANFFLINSKGIVFGENAQLNVNSSFVASTAESIEFDDGYKFSTTNINNSQSSLTISFPVSLGLGSSPGAIAINGTGNQIIPDYTFTSTKVANNLLGLSVQAKKTLALIGGDINVNGGTINANDGRIELVSINSGSANFKPSENGFAFSFDDVDNYQNITLDNLSVLNTSGSEGGDVILNAASVALQDGSLILIQNQGNLPSGTLDINAAQSFTLSGTSNDGNVSSVIRSEATNSGKSADINIFTSQLVLQHGSRIGSTTYSDALAGNVTVSAESVQLLENTLINPNRQTYVVSGISTVSFGDGNAGNLQLKTSNLDITSGASIQSSVSGTGNGGNVNINAEKINISGINPDSQRTIPSAIAASVNSGQAGNLIIDVAQLQIKDGGVVAASTFGTGNAGRIYINAAERIDINGKNNGLSSSIRSNVASVTSKVTQQRVGTPLVPTGQGGDVIINTPLLNVNSGGVVSVGNEGTGNAGTLSINAKDINLDSTGSITATAAFGQGGNIKIDADSLQLDNESQVTSKAGNKGNSGNITINTTNLIST